MASKQSNPDQLTPRRRKALSLVERADIAMIEAIAPVGDTTIGKRLGKVGKIGDEPPLLVISSAVAVVGLLTRQPRLLRTGIRMLAAELVAIKLKDIGKNRINRTRPKALIEKNEYRLERGQSQDEDMQAFPSGHTAGSVAVTRALAREYPRFPAVRGLGMAIGALQVVRRKHFPLDILVGAVLGVVAERASRVIAAPLLRRI